MSRSFGSVSSFVQCKYDGGPQPGPVTFGVLHDAETPLQAGYAASIASYFTRNTNSTSAHFMVDPVATVQMLDTSRVAWHCGNGNARSVGVEQAGYASFTTDQWTTPAGLAQMGRVAALMRDLHAVHGIGLHWMSDAELLAAHTGRTVGGWATHDQVHRVLGGTTHTDPMPHYPLDQLMALATQEDTMPTAAEIAAAVWGFPLQGINGLDAAGNPTVGPVPAGTRLANTDTKTAQLEEHPHSLNSDLRGWCDTAGKAIADVQTKVAAAPAATSAVAVAATDIKAALLDPQVQAVLVKALADELDRRARDGDASTGPVS